MFVTLPAVPMSANELCYCRMTRAGSRVSATGTLPAVPMSADEL
jgi:hypothetical protein